MDANMADMFDPADDVDLMDDQYSPDMVSFDLDLSQALPEPGLNPYDSLAQPNGHQPHDPYANAHNNHAARQLSTAPTNADTDFDPQQDVQMDTNMSGVGAGPLPTSYGMQLAPGAGSTITDFTKRRNWSQRVIEELRDFLHILTPDGRIVYVSPSAKALTGHEPHHMVGKIISDFIHPDDGGIFVREFNESIASANPLRFFYRFRKADDTYTIFESYGHPHLASEAASFGPNCGASFCRGFFMMSRPYPTKSASMLDSFLEHKIENERLKKRISDLKREEAEDLEGMHRTWLKKQDSITPSESQDTAGGAGNGDSQTPTTGAVATPDPNNYDGMPPPAKPSAPNNPLTRKNLNVALAGARPDSINDKMARYEGATHLETIEMLTGLRYRDGERSKGISTGAASPTLIRGDAGIAILVDKDGKPTQSSRGYSGSPFSDDKKKKMKVADEYVCTHCGTLDSPEWRKGPSGPKTLCNACGLRWAKKEKKRTGENGNGDGEQTPTNGNSVHTPSTLPNSAQHSARMGVAIQQAGPPIQPNPAGIQPHPAGPAG